MDKFDKLKLASSSFGERLKTGGAQMGRMVSTKMKEILQAPTPESKIVDEATLETMEEPNWGLNMRICAMINSEEFNGTEIVKGIKKKIGSSKSPVSQRLVLDLLEACTSNCEKVFSEVASEKVLDDMVRMIQDPRTDQRNRTKAVQLIRAWGESEELMYLPVFRQTYLSLKSSGIPAGSQDGSSPVHRTLESYVNQQPMPPPERYPLPAMDLRGADDETSPYIYSVQSVEEKKELLVVARNSLDLLSSILDSVMEPIAIKDDLTVSMLENCKQSLPVIRRIAETTTNDDALLFEALNLHDELQQVISRCEEIEGAMAPGAKTANNASGDDPATPKEAAKPDSPKATDTEPSIRVQEAVSPEEKSDSSYKASVKEAVSDKPASDSGGEVKDTVARKDENTEEKRPA